MGEGEDLIGILCHVDVVPEGDGWVHDPFDVQIADGKLYGRGVCDDKGPAIIALYAAEDHQRYGHTDPQTRTSCIRHERGIGIEVYGILPQQRGRIHHGLFA